MPGPLFLSCERASDFLPAFDARRVGVRVVVDAVAEEGGELAEAEEVVAADVVRGQLDPPAVDLDRLRASDRARGAVGEPGRRLAVVGLPARDDDRVARGVVGDVELRRRAAQQRREVAELEEVMHLIKIDVG